MVQEILYPPNMKLRLTIVYIIVGVIFGLVMSEGVKADADEAFASGVIWPICTLVYFTKGIFKLVSRWQNH